LFYEIFIAPVKGFGRIKEKPTWVQAVVPLVVLFALLIILDFAFRWITFPQMMLLALKDGYGFTPQEVLADPDLASLLVPDTGMIVSGVWNSVVMLFLGLLLQSALFHFIIVKDNKLLPGTIAVVAWSKFPLIIAWILKILVGGLLHKPAVNFSPAMLMSEGSKLAPGLGVLDIFSIWTLILTALGLSVLTEKQKLSAITVFGLWVAWFLFMLIKGLAFG